MFTPKGGKETSVASSKEDQGRPKAETQKPKRGVVAPQHAAPFQSEY
jgi:hypothetical protein